jgi:hypothetical protein
VLGTHLLVVGAIDCDEHQRRARERRLPVVDPWMFDCVAHADPSFLTRRSPVRIDGAIVARRSWVSARSALGCFAAFGPRVAVLPQAQTRQDRVAASAILHGFGIVADHDGDLRVVHYPDETPPQERTWVHRLVEEALYDAFLTSPRIDSTTGGRAEGDVTPSPSP